uniref:Uncharacterized protein n=1 Tax=Arundo donax TaxID=35708 RepID=A0A0A9EK10_ARUDO
MEQDTRTFKPQWLMQPLGAVKAAGAASIWAAASSSSSSSRAGYHGKAGSSRNHSSGHDRDHSSRQSSSRKSSGSSGSRQSDQDGMGKSKGYANFGKNRERDWGKDVNSRDKESRSVAADRDGFKSFSTCRPERDRLNRIRLKGDTWSKGVVNLNNGSRSNADVSSSTRSNDVVSSSESRTGNTSLSTTAASTSVSAVSNASVSTSRSNASMAFEREFPELSTEDRNGRQGISKVPSPGISTPIQNVPLVNTSDGWNSVLAEIPLSTDTKKSPAASSVLQIAPNKQTEAVVRSGTALSMAETVMQAPLRISTGPQLSIEAQKIEERTLRQYTLRPLTPPASKSSVLSSLKTKTARLGDPGGPSKTAQQLKIHSANGSVRAPVKTDVSKLSQSGSFQVLSREQNGTAHTSKDCPSNPVSPPPTPLVSMEPQKKPAISQKFKMATHELPLPLQGPCGDRKSNARDKHRFFEMLRTKSSNGSSTAFESGCQPSPSSLVDGKQDSSLNLENGISLLQSGMECMGNGKCFCGDANSSEGSQRHLSDNEENISSLKQEVADGVSQLLVKKIEADSSSEPADTGDEEFQLSLSDSAEGGSSSAPTDSDDGCNRSQCSNEEARSSSDTESGDEEHPAEPSPDDKSFLIALGWREDEVVQPLGFDEIADSVKGCEELAKKLWSMKSNANVQILLLSIFGQS